MSGEGIFARERARRGTVLIVVLLVAVLLTAMVTEFVYRVSLDISRVKNVETARGASLYARSGVVAAAMLARQSMRRYHYSYPGKMSIPVPEPFPGQEGMMVFEIEDENGKLDPNMLVNQSGDPNDVGQETFRALLGELGLDEDLVESITDWIDPDSIPTARSTAEKNAKNAYLWSISELNDIPGISAEVFDALRPYVTVFNHETGLYPYEINLNAAELPVLRALRYRANEGDPVTPALAEGEPERIIEEREKKPLTMGDEKGDEEDTMAVTLHTRISLANHGSLVGKGLVDVKGRVFSLRATGQVGEIRRIIEAVVDTGDRGNDLRVLAWREY